MDTTSEFKCDDSMLDLSKEDFKLEFLRLKSSCKEYQQIIDDRTQEAHVLKRQVELLTAQDLEYQHEIEHLASSEAKKSKILQDRILELETIINKRSSESYAEEIDRLQSERLALRNTVAKLEETLNNVPPSINKAEFDALVEENEAIKSKYDFAYTRYANTMEELKQRNDQVKKLIDELEDTRNTYASNSMDMKVKLEEHEEQVATLRAELSTAQAVQEDKQKDSHESRGNSMFAEVYDNWIRLKQKNDNLAKAYQEARKERNKLRNEADALRLENASMCARWKTEVIEAKQMDNDLIVAYKYANEKLEALIRNFEEDIAKERNINYYLPDTHANVYMNMIKSKNEQIEKLNKEFRQANGNTIRHCVEVREVNAKAQKYLTEATQYKNELEELRDQLYTLQQNEESATNSKVDAPSADNSSKCLQTATELKCSCQVRRSMRDVGVMTERMALQQRTVPQPCSILRAEKESPLGHSPSLLPNTLIKADTSSDTSKQSNNDSGKENDSTADNIFRAPNTVENKRVQFADSALAAPFVNQQRRKPRPKGKPMDLSQLIVIKRQ